MKKINILFCFALIAITGKNSVAQCPNGQSEIYLEIMTDAYGYETYWELVPGTNNCGVAAIATGGNSAVGCNGAGAQNQDPGGYGDNTLYTDGPWCLDDYTTFTLHHIDDWGDGGPLFTVMIGGFPVYEFQGTGSGNVWTFDINPPLAFDLTAEKILTPAYLPADDITVRAEIKNVGTTTLTDLTINYSIDNGTPVSENLNGLNLLPFTKQTIVFNTLWGAYTPADYSLKVWASDLNGNTDMYTANDEIEKIISIGEPVPFLIDQYLTATPIFTPIVDGADLIDLPRDLDFHPNFNNMELWVINEGTEASGGSVVIVHDAGEASQISEWKIDGNATHFMDLPTGIAFSENGNFATAPGVLDANHDGGQPFTGPALWDSDLSVFGEPSGGNGSHIDMLHESSYAMGIAHQSENAFWVFDSYNHDIVMYDFQMDHGPGNDDHADGILHRYPEVNVSRINETIPCHLDLDKQNGWLYIVDGGNNRVVRMDIYSGTASGTPAYPQFEPLQAYQDITGVTQEVVVPLSEGLLQPSGIALKDNRMLVSEYLTGDIIIYDITTMPAIEMGRIVTGSAGVMGITIGPDGKIWYVNHTTNQVMRIDGVEYTALVETNAEGFELYPNITSGLVNISLPSSENKTEISVTNSVGQIVYSTSLESGIENAQLNLSDMSNGIYFVNCDNGKELFGQEIIVQR